MKSSGSFRYLFALYFPAPLLVAVLAAALAIVALSAQSAAAQPAGAAPLFGLSDNDPVAISASFEIEEGAPSRENPTQRGRLKVVVELAPEWHIYSVTQKKGGPTPTSFELQGPESVELLGPFAPESPPSIEPSADWPGLDVEEHVDHVVWTAPIAIAEGTSPKDLEIQVKMKGLTCRTGGACVPLSETLTASFAGRYQAVASTGEYRAENGVVTWRGEIVPPVVAPGESALLRLTAIPDEGFHVYASSITDSPSSTNFVLTKLSGLRATPPTTEGKLKSQAGIGGAPAVSYHEGTVTWNIRLSVPEDAKPGEHEIRGMVGYQACTETSCRRPLGLQFQTSLTVGNASGGEPVPIAISKARHSDVLTAAATTDWTDQDDAEVQIKESGVSYSLPIILAMALIGGLILNLMPCVLPVVGLKLMALVESAGDDQRRILSHNLWYSFGLLTVFWGLAAIAIAVRWRYGTTFGWGQQFTFVEFRLFMILLVFVMALSFLGVWEIPLPGFASGKASQQLQKKEGPAGAYFKGIFTTLLATPCSGPFLGAVFGFTLAASYPVIALIFTAVGFGMALPYILIGFMPSLVFWLPKPGAWMETFKQLMAFVLLGTVAFLFGGFDEDHKMAVFVTLIGAWFACWMIGRVPLWDTLQRRLTAWGGGIASAALVGVLAFQLLVPGDEIVPWEPFSEARLAQLRAEGRTVMIDFTADWCLSCKYNYYLAINTEQTAEMIRELNAVPMLADLSEQNEEATEKLVELESASIPILAIYPGDSPNQPIVLRDMVSQGEVLEALREAGPSVSSKIATRTVSSSL